MDRRLRQQASWQKRGIAIGVVCVGALIFAGIIWPVTFGRPRKKKSSVQEDLEKYYQQEMAREQQQQTRLPGGKSRSL